MNFLQAGIFNHLYFVDVYYNNDTEIWDKYPEQATFAANGWLGGQQQLVSALQGVLDLSGDIDFVINGTVEGSLSMFMHKGGNTGDTEGYVSVILLDERIQKAAVTAAF